MSKTVEFFTQGPPKTSDVVKAFVNGLPRHSDNTAKEMFMDTFVHETGWYADVTDHIQPNPSKRDSLGNRVDYYYYGPPKSFLSLHEYDPPWLSTVSSERKQERKEEIGKMESEFEFVASFSFDMYTEAARKEASISLNKQSELTENLNRRSQEMKGLFSRFFRPFISIYYPATRDLQRTIKHSPEEKEGFRNAMLTQNFINNVNTLFQSGGDDARDATNDMFNLISSACLFGFNSMTTELASAGMNLPDALRGENFKTYTGWFQDGFSTDLFTSRMSWFKQDMRMRMSGYGSPLYKDIDEPNGYCKSFCLWSATSSYN